MISIDCKYILTTIFKQTRKVTVQDLNVLKIEIESLYKMNEAFKNTVDISITSLTFASYQYHNLFVFNPNTNTVCRNEKPDNTYINYFSKGIPIELQDAIETIVHEYFKKGIK